VKTINLAVVLVMLSLGVLSASAQQPTANQDQRVPLSQAAIALDAAGAPALESTLVTSSPNGAPDTPVTNIRIVVKNVSAIYYSYVSGIVTFYDSSGIRCGEGIFNSDVMAPNESVETDTPGIRIRCAPGSWRVVATNLVPRSPLNVLTSTTATTGNLLISVDGEEHPIQIDKPMVLTLGDTRRTILLKRAP
jgi:hypothetical protein